MVVTAFPPLEDADESGFLAIGGDLDVETLLLAYSTGIFPWPLYPSGELAWFSPPRRALLFLEDFHLPRKLKKIMRQDHFELVMDRDFAQVITNCAYATNRTDGGGTWITDRVVDAYVALHKSGYAHSVECYRGSQLVGGLYGVSLGAMFAGESMFYKETGCSKLCLCFLAEFLIARGGKWIDCQQSSQLLTQFGATTVPRGRFLRLLRSAIDAESPFTLQK